MPLSRIICNPETPNVDASTPEAVTRAGSGTADVHNIHQHSIEGRHPPQFAQNVVCEGSRLIVVAEKAPAGVRP